MNKLQILQHIYDNYPQIEVQCEDFIEIRSCFGSHQPWIKIPLSEDVSQVLLDSILNSLVLTVNNDIFHMLRFLEALVNGYAEEFKKVASKLSTDHMLEGHTVSDATGAIHYYELLNDWWDGEKIDIPDAALHRTNLLADIEEAN